MVGASALGGYSNSEGETCLYRKIQSGSAFLHLCTRLGRGGVKAASTSLPKRVANAFCYSTSTTSSMSASRYNALASQQCPKNCLTPSDVSQTLPVKTSSSFSQRVRLI
jgi:CxxC motif-containing protein (DUF1111 family)